MKCAIISTILLCIIITLLWPAILIFLVCSGLISAQPTTHSVKFTLLSYSRTSSCPSRYPAYLRKRHSWSYFCFRYIYRRWYSYLAPINSSDHDSQSLRIRLPCSVSRTIICRHIDYDGLRLLLNKTDWTASFPRDVSSLTSSPIALAP